MMEQFHSEDGDVLAKAKEALMQLLQRPDVGQAYFILDEAEQPVGYCILCFGFSIESGGRDAFVDEFFIKSERRDQGHGGLAIKLLSQEAKKLGVNKLFLEVAPENKSAQTIYKHSGFALRSNYQLMQLDL